MMAEWVPVLAFLAIAFMIPAGMVTLGFVFGSRRRRRDVFGNRMIAFESGVSTGHAGRQRFPVDFYLTAMLFIIFDIEMVFLFPLGAIIDQLGTFGLIELLIFIGILVVGYVYVWGRGALEWE